VLISTGSEANERLRIGVMLDSQVVPAWVYAILEDIQQSDYGRVELVILNAAEVRRPTLSQRLKQLPIIPFILYTRIDQRLFGKKSVPNAFAPVSAEQLLNGVDVLQAVPIQKGFSDRFQPEDIAVIRGARLDVLLRFGFRIIKGEILDCARFGVWSFHHDDNRYYRGGPALFWEMFEGNPESGSILQILSEKLDGGRVIYRSISSTNFASLFLNRNPIYWKTAEFMPRRLRDLHRHGAKYIDSLATCREELSYERGIYKLPRPGKLAWFLFRTFWTNVRRQLAHRLFDVKWFVSVAARPRSLLSIDSSPSFRRLPSPRRGFFADPVLFERQGRTFLFVEQYEWRSRKGVIAVVEMLSDGKFSNPRVVLERPYHVSYPFVFAWKDDVYMIPESAANRTVELYRAVSFPHTWELIHTPLRDLLAVDATVHIEDDKLWIFMNIARNDVSPNDELYLFVADSPTAEWRSHPANPIVSDVRKARPAGGLFREEGALIRPAQNCVKTYGGSVVLNRVLLLNEKEYAEETIGEITPEWVGAKDGLHTISVSSALVATDSKSNVFRRRGRG
jgi:hypothetical protein